MSKTPKRSARTKQRAKDPFQSSPISVLSSPASVDSLAKGPKRKTQAAQAAEDPFQNLPPLAPTRNPSSVSISRLDDYTVPDSPSPSEKHAGRTPMQPPPSNFFIQEPASNSYAPARTTLPLSQIAEAYRSQRNRQGEDWRRAGTGVHDNYLTTAGGNFRHPSLRRDSGMIVETPVAVRKDINRRKQEGQWLDQLDQPTAAPQAASGLATTMGPPQVHNNPYGLTQARERRMDVPPLTFARTVGSQRPQTTAQAAVVGNSPAENGGVQKKTPQSFSMPCKVMVMKVCLGFKEEFLKMSPVPLHDQKPFWNGILQQLQSHDVTRDKFTGESHLRSQVDAWSGPRRINLREAQLPPVSQGQPELDELVDKWNQVFAQRFCNVHRGFVESAMWPLVEERVLSTIQTELHTWIAGSLQERREELERQTRPTFLGSNSTTKNLKNIVISAQDKIQESRHDLWQVLQTEAVVSLVLDLQPGLERDPVAPRHAAVAETERRIASQEPLRNWQEEGIRPSIEGTPGTAPRSTGQPQNQENKSRGPQNPQEDNRQTRSSPAGGHAASKKRKQAQQAESSPGFVDSLSIRSRNAQQGQRPDPMSTPSRPPSKRLRTNESEPAGTPNSDSSLSEFPSLTKWLKSGRRSQISGILQQPQLGEQSTSASGNSLPTQSEAFNTALQCSPELGSTPYGRGPQSQTPSGPARKTTKNTPKGGGSKRGRKSSRSHPKSSKIEMQDGSHGHQQSQGNTRGSPHRFRESTVDFQAMTPLARDKMLYRKFKEIANGQDA
ncbi:hypothetical protein FZEAL_2038 [Fusarium zealandicum]|uniref:Uncharacterized protein n=1 Tax=Fusarium zealandicum TaxID=1053134 RepID=A0A8H4XPB5_9HYPO|nr:hypothetical protein FZEAL_2038 [Fusarium zealandicum]